MVIEVANLSKTYRSNKVLDAFSVTIPQGDYFGLLGENGSGKSTLVAVLLGLTRADPGSLVKLFGRDVALFQNEQLRMKVGVVGEAAQINDDRTVWEYLDFFSRLYGLPDRFERIAKRLDQVGLADSREKKLRTLSRGMKQRLALARALLHDPELLILDEPINGLDPKGVHDVRELLEAQHREGTTIFICSHLLSEIEKSCSRVAVIHKGRLLACGNTAAIAQGNLEDAYLRIVADAQADAEAADRGGA
jgi:ABC-2 type transport system ATP-binding protein